jgi:hypothetical protein
MSMVEQFLKDLETTPEDWRVRGIFADWCEDNTQPQLAACLRWMTRLHKRPYHGASGRATWFNADTISSGLGDPESDIPGVIYDLLEGGQKVANHKAYLSMRSAEEAFYSAWQKARERGWNPDD